MAQPIMIKVQPKDFDVWRTQHDGQERLGKTTA